MSITLEMSRNVSLIELQWYLANLDLPTPIPLQNQHTLTPVDGIINTCLTANLNNVDLGHVLSEHRKYGLVRFLTDLIPVVKDPSTAPNDPNSVISIAGEPIKNSHYGSALLYFLATFSLGHPEKDAVLIVTDLLNLIYLHLERKRSQDIFFLYRVRQQSGQDLAIIDRKLLNIHHYAKSLQAQG